MNTAPSSKRRVNHVPTGPECAEQSVECEYRSSIQAILAAANNASAPLHNPSIKPHHEPLFNRMKGTVLIRC
jgi:hypothetical protein